MADRRLLTANRSGVHFLACRRVAAELVRSAGVRAGDLVMDLGAGQGAITAPLAAAGARVLAVERDEAFVRQLRRRFADQPAVRVVHADVRSVPLPRRDFKVVASIPFAVSTPLLRRVLDTRGSALTGADLLVEWGAARRLTAPRPRTLEAAWWSARFELRIRRQVPASCFSPAPRVDAAHLVVRRRDLDRRVLGVLWTLLRAAYADPLQPARAVPQMLVPRRRAHRLLTASGIDPPAPAVSVPVHQWCALATALATSPDGLALPPPRHTARR